MTTRRAGESHASLLERPVPLHFRVREHLIQLMSSGALTPGDQVPTEQELMDRFKVSRTTVRRALQDLVTVGAVRRHPGRGSFVAEPRIEQELRRLTGFVEDMEALELTPTAKVIKVASASANLEVAQQLRLPAGTRVVHIQRVRIANGEPISFDDTYLPTDIGEQIAQENLVVDPIFMLLERKYGIQLSEAEYRIEASTANVAIARHLGVRTGTPMFLIKRTTCALDGRPIDYERLYYRGDRVCYRMRLQR
ncbi:MAG TPA: GntR family transcriptional regulator [Methylomirabilota bacterium]|jgi:GntR family transcriptional regulator|nr:GntR family transcriptional regulator [Methylomirabilota bacterium]